MKDSLIGYFFAEKRESVVFVVVGLLALAIGAYVAWSGGGLRGMILPLALVGLIQIAVGGTVFTRTDAQVATLVEQLERAPAELAREETARMEKVLRGFTLYKTIELAIFALGVGLTFAYPRRPLLYSAGIGCVGQASIMLVLDLFAEHRAQTYVDALRALARG